MLIVGPTGSGKTPLGDLCESKKLWGFGCVHFDFGAELRKIEQTGPIPAALTKDDVRVIRDSLRTGKLLENENFHVAEKILTSFLEGKNYRETDILILNGLPRHMGQAKDVDAIADIKLLVYLQCRPENICLRIAQNAGGDRTGRNDDAEDAVESKLSIFQERTFPLLEYYRNKGAVVETMPVEACSRPEEMYQWLSGKGYPRLYDEFGSRREEKISNER